ncbi:MAG: DUF779 domain-containing protein [Actinomycetota bacterium]
MKISTTNKAKSIVERVIGEGRSNLVMVLGTGCCDSTAPYLYDNYLPEPDSERIGEIEGIDVLAPSWLAKLYAGDSELIIDVDEGVVNDSFSLESEYDCRFTLRVPQSYDQR